MKGLYRCYPHLHKGTYSVLSGLYRFISVMIWVLRGLGVQAVGGLGRSCGWFSGLRTRGIGCGFLDVDFGCL